MKSILKIILTLLAGGIVVFGLLFYVLLQLPTTAYLLMIAVLSLLLSILALRSMGRYERLEGLNYENYKDLRDRVEELEREDFHFFEIHTRGCTVMVKDTDEESAREKFKEKHPTREILYVIRVNNNEDINKR